MSRKSLALTKPYLIGIHGKARSGKDSLAKILAQKVNLSVMAFADPLKLSCATMMSLPLIDMYTGDRESKIEGFDFC